MLDGYDNYTCVRCGNQVALLTEKVDDSPTCAVCAKLGDRSLVWFLAHSAEEGVRKKFDAARGRSWMRDDIERALRRGIKHLPPGVLQLARERQND